MAGAIKARKASKHALSDWMAIEKDRGISVTSSVMKFEYADCEINLLDTPGSPDFSEDTYRVLTAVDSALMVIDGAKGVETPKPRSLWKSAVFRNTPIITFINKLDRDCLSPLDILADIEDKLQIECSPLSWPIGMEKRFKGVYNIYDKKLHLFTPGKAKRSEGGVVINDLSDPLLDELLGSQAGELREEIALLEGAANPFDLKEYVPRHAEVVVRFKRVQSFVVDAHRVGVRMVVGEIGAGQHQGVAIVAQHFREGHAKRTAACR